jgi:hypothetical protein
MPSGWFVLCRCWVRVDGTFVRVFDTRFAHFFADTPSRVLVEVSKKEASFEELKQANKPAQSMLLRDSNAVSEFLPSVENYVDEILLFFFFFFFVLRCVFIQSLRSLFYCVRIE